MPVPTKVVNKTDLAEAAIQHNSREREIARQYFNSSPRIDNLVKAAYHWYKSVPSLGGKNVYTVGDVPTPGMRSPKSMLSEGEVLKAAKDSKTLIQNLINSKPYKARVVRHLKNAGKHENNADFEIARMNTTLNESKVTPSPKVYNKARQLVDGKYSPSENTIYLSQKPSVPIHEVGAHEYSHATETPQILKLNKAIFDEVKPKSSAVIKDGITDMTDFDYANALIEKRANAMSVLADMYERGIYDVDKYLQTTNNSNLRTLIDNFGKSGAKKLLDNVVGLAPAAYLINYEPESKNSR